MVQVPPIKSQGIKTKLTGWIEASARQARYERWVEPFMGTGVVAFNVRPKVALLCDSNPHLIRFYQALQAGIVNGKTVRQHLTDEGQKLLKTEGEHYYTVRDRFNDSAEPLDFLFLNRACFNGMMRFNRKGGFNVPFCRKPGRYAPALITKIVNQVEAVSALLATGDYTFKHQAFGETLNTVRKGDLVYCDPPYIGRHVDYYDSWSAEDEAELHERLTHSSASFIMSTWFRNKYRTNEYIGSLWRDCFITTKEHFYHVGAKETNRNAVEEALLTNFKTDGAVSIPDMLSSLNNETNIVAKQQKDPDFTPASQRLYAI